MMYSMRLEINGVRFDRNFKNPTSYTTDLVFHEKQKHDGRSLNDYTYCVYKSRLIQK